MFFGAGMSTIGERLQLIAKHEDLNMKDVSEKTGISYRSIQSYFSGKQQPGAEALGKLRVAYGIDLNWLLTGDDTTLSNKEDLDYVLLYDAILFLRRSYPDEFKYVTVEFLIYTVVHFYNSALKCSTEKERDLVWAAQIKMVNAIEIKNEYEECLNLLPPEQRNFPDATLLLQNQLDSLTKKNHEIVKESIVQTFNAPVDQVAGRDINNR